MRTQDQLNISYEQTRNLVVSKEKETGIYVDGFYTEFFEMSQSGRAYKVVEDDRVVHVACSACVTDGGGVIFVPFYALNSAIAFADRNGIIEHIGG